MKTLNLTHRLLSPFAFLFVASVFVNVAGAENWPGWRGADRNGVSSEKNIPVSWSETEGVVWKVPLVGSGISSPIIWNDRVFVTASDGPKRANLHVICLELETGRQLWHRKFWGTAPTRFHGSMSSMATPTPVTDGENIYAFFGTGDIFSLDVNGHLNWQRSLSGEYGVFENRFAAASCPLLFRDMVLLQCDHYGDSYLVALDKTTGANRWKTDRPKNWLSWSSPQLINIEGTDRHELIVSGSHKIDAFNPTTGTKLWTVQGMSRECIPTPVTGNGLIYVVSGPNSRTVAIRPGGRGDVTDTHVQWRNTRSTPFVPSAILVGERYYLVTDKGIGMCLNANTGDIIWRRRFSSGRSKASPRFTSSPVACKGRVYFTDESGTTHVVASNARRFRKLALNTLNESAYSTPAISQGRIFLRTSKHLFCIGPSKPEK